jgi:hypothetical protein
MIQLILILLTAARDQHVFVVADDDAAACSIALAALSNASYVFLHACLLLLNQTSPWALCLLLLLLLLLAVWPQQRCQ